MIGIACDALTASRLLFALAIVWISWRFGKESLLLMVALLLCAWTTDVLDGKIARKINKPKTWVGERDAEFDILIVSSVLLYFGICGFISKIIALPWALTLAIFIFLKPSKDLVLISKAVSVVFVVIFLFFLLEIKISGIIIFWMLVAVIFDWQRFRQLAGQFLRTLNCKNRKKETGGK